MLLRAGMSSHVIPLAGHWILPAGLLVPRDDMMLAQHRTHGAGSVVSIYMDIYYAWLVPRVAEVADSK